ncbi:MAG: hypothetical protein AAGA30_04220 [Planctomycetota bacterium]
MVTGKQKKAATVAASFGVAMASMYAVHELNAEILDITWNGGNASATCPFDLGGDPFAQDVDQVPNGVLTSALGGVATINDFFQWNDTYGDGVGRTIGLYVESTTGGTPLVGGPMSLAVVNEGDVIDPNTFVGAVGTDGSPAGVGGTEFDGTGSAFVAVRPRAVPDTLYWFKIQFSSVGEALVYTEGQYGSEGEALTVGNPVGCPSAPGDVNGDEAVDLLDVGPFVDLITEGKFNCAGDINGDEAVDLLDVGPFVDLLTGG